MAVATHPTVVFSREQREACHELLWEEIFEGASRNDAGRLRLMMAACRLFEAVDLRNDDPDRDARTFVVDDEIAWLFADFLAPFVEEYARPWLEDNPQQPEFPTDLWVDTEEARAYQADWYARQVRLHRALIAATEAITAAVAS
jgi:hypothetical protein